MVKYFTLIIILVLLINCPKKVPNLLNGDIVFQTSLSPQSKAIQLATNSKYSHMGILYEDHGNYYVYEAIESVKSTKLEEWIKRGEHGHYVVKRIRNANKILTPEILRKMKEIGDGFKGKNYDLYFEWSDERLYCSELVWKIYKRALNMEIGNLQNIREFDLSHPIVQPKIKERYGNNLPVDGVVISPSQMFNSDHLIEVYSN